MIFHKNVPTLIWYFVNNFNEIYKIDFQTYSLENRILQLGQIGQRSSEFGKTYSSDP